MNRAMPRAGLTASDAFSALRIAFALLIALLYSSARDAAFVVLLAFVLAVATDIVGELLGRGGPTLPGSVLDSLADKALVYSVLVGHGFPMLSFMLPLIARDTVAVALRFVAGGQGTVLVVDRLGRLKTATLYVACAAAVTLAWLQSGSSTVPSALAVPPGDLGVTLLYLGLLVLALIGGTLLSYITLFRYFVTLRPAAR